MAMANIDPSLEKYYEYFMKKYEEHYSLFFPKDKSSNNKPDITEAIYARLYNIITKITRTSLDFIPRALQSPFDSKPYINYFLNETVAFKNGPRQTIPEQTHLLIYHGGPNYDLFKIPEGCIIVVLTSIGRLAIQVPDRYKLLKENAKEKVEFTKFVSNPICYKRNEYKGIFSDASVYLPGQYCYNINLGEETDNTKPLFDNWGIHTYTYKSDIETDISRDISEKDTTLFTLIDSKGLRGLIIVDCCRSLNTNPYINFNNTIIMKQYETFIRILNKSVFFFKQNPDGNFEEDNEGFKDCDKIVIFDAFKSECVKPIRYYSQMTSPNDKKIYKMLLSHIPTLTGFSKTYSNSNSVSRSEFIRLLSGSKVINKIIAWLQDCNNDPATVSLNTLFTELISLLNNPNPALQYAEEYQIRVILRIRNFKLFNTETKIFKIVIDILVSFIVYILLIDSNVLDKDAITQQLMEFLSVYDDINLYLNGLNLTLENLARIHINPKIKKAMIPFDYFKNNIFLRNNSLTGIPVFLICELTKVFFKKEINVRVYEYKHLDLTGNPLSFTQENIVIDGYPIQLITEKFMNKYYNVLDLANPELAKCILDYYDATMTVVKQHNPKRSRLSNNSQAGGKQHQIITKKNKQNKKIRKSRKNNNLYSKLSRKINSK